MSIRPLFEGLKSSTGSPDEFAKSAAKLAAKNYVWKIVSHASTRELNAHLYPDMKLYIMAN